MSGDNSLSVDARLALSEALAKLPDPQFKRLVFALTPPPGSLPADLAALGDRAIVLLQWVENRGPGLAVLQQALAQIAGPAARDPLPESPQPDSIYPRFSFEAVIVNPQGQMTTRQPASAAYQPVDLGQGVTLEMVLIPGGPLMMGSPHGEPHRDGREGPQHPVTLAPFWIGKYPVTQAQYQAIMGNNPAHFKGDNRPVEQVSWHDAVEFCDRLSKQLGQPYTLPSEAQWEYACRAGTTTPFNCGETLTTDLANYHGHYTYGSGPQGTYRQQTTDVGIFPANGFGLHDMHGNVWEWCLDHDHDDYQGAPRDGRAWVDAEAEENKPRILRGGAWHYLPGDCRCAYRYNGYPVNRYFGSGFRVVTVPPRALPQSQPA